MPAVLRLHEVVNKMAETLLVRERSLIASAGWPSPRCGICISAYLKGGTKNSTYIEGDTRRSHEREDPSS